MKINKITFEYYQEADNEVGSEELEVIVNPTLIGLFTNKNECDYYITLKSEHGFSFDNSDEIIELFKKIEIIVNQLKK